MQVWVTRESSVQVQFQSRVVWNDEWRNQNTLNISQRQNQLECPSVWVEFFSCWSIAGMESKWRFKILSDSQSTPQIKQVIFMNFKLDWLQTDPAHWVERTWSEFVNPKSLKSKLCLASDKTESRTAAEFNNSQRKKIQFPYIKVWWFNLKSLTSLPFKLAV